MALATKHQGEVCFDPRCAVHIFIRDLWANSLSRSLIIISALLNDRLRLLLLLQPPCEPQLMEFCYSFNTIKYHPLFRQLIRPSCNMFNCNRGAAQPPWHQVWCRHLPSWASDFETSTASQSLTSTALQPSQSADQLTRYYAWFPPQLPVSSRATSLSLVACLITHTPYPRTHQTVSQTSISFRPQVVS